MVPERRGRTPYANLRINTGEVWGGYRELLGEEEETGPDVRCASSESKKKIFLTSDLVGGWVRVYIIYISQSKSEFSVACLNFVIVWSL
jgi:hypothetical protein